MIVGRLLFGGPAPAQAALKAIDLECACRAAIEISMTDEDDFQKLADSSICIYFIDGFLSYEAVTKVTDPAGPHPFCLPAAGIPVEQAARIYLRHLEKNPQDLHWTAATILTAALHDAFPC